jgi:hypothetical protein
MFQSPLKIFFIALIHVVGRSVYAQSEAIDTTSIREVVNRWNEAHHEMSEDDFDELYASTVLFYANYLGKRACIEKKLSLLNKGAFQQHIGSDLQLTFYEGGIVYCGFTKEVTTARGIKSYPSYLLLKRMDDRYVITGESDLVTDRNLKFHLALGPQLHISELSFAPLARKPGGSSPQPVVGLVIVAFLFLTGGMVIYYLRKRSVPKPKADQAPRSTYTERKLTSEEEAWRKTQLEKGQAFEKFVVNRFRQKAHVFTWMDATSDKGSQDHHPASNLNPDLQYEFRIEGRAYPFAVECKYRSKTSGIIQVAEDSQIKRYQRFGYQRRMEVFVVLGLGGTPDNPSELYVIPISQVKPEMHHDTLTPYKAAPAFSYDVAKRRLF